MGLLDDAIREHLELKRLRGADPSEVARAENEALGPVQREAEPTPDDEREPEQIGGEVSAEPDESASQASEAPEDESASSRPSGIGQETVEIDMEQALAGESAVIEAPPGAQTARAAPVGHPAHTQPASGDSLEWEMPGDRDKDQGSDEIEAEEPVEDVLEETPDFLRETPEHERLWFEQRPPRDFDFNE